MFTAAVPFRFGPKHVHLIGVAQLVISRFSSSDRVAEQLPRGLAAQTGTARTCSVMRFLLRKGVNENLGGQR